MGTDAEQSQRSLSLGIQDEIEHRPAPRSLRSFGGVSLPSHPRTVSSRLHAIQADLVLEGVHALPESVPAERQELAFGDQSGERLLDQLISFLHVIEYLAPQNEEAAINPERLLGHDAHMAHDALLI